MTSEFKDESLKFKDKTFLEQYLAGKAPLHADSLNLPSEEELEAAETEFDELLAASRKPARHIHLWPWAVGIAAAFVIAFILWPKAVTEDDATPLAIDETPKVQEHEQEAQPVMVQQANQEHLLTVNKKDKTDSQKGVDEPLQEKITGLTIVPTSADLGPGVTMRLGGQCSMLEGEETLAEEKVEEQQPSPIPPNKQALADIYLAEMALQVAYERQAQAEALRAYAASLTGEDAPKPIIAF